MEENRKKRKSKRKNFKKFLFIYIGVFAVFMVVTWLLLYSFIKDYEEGQPRHVLDELVENFTEDNLKKLIGDDISTCEFETKEQVISYMEECSKEGELTYRKKANKDGDDNTLVYELIAGKKAIAKVSLVSEKKNKHNFDVWTIGNVNVSDYITGEDAQAYRIVVPAGSVVTLNGKTVGTEYLLDEVVTAEACKNVSDFVKQPTMSAYEVKGLLFAPTVEATLDGKQLEKTEEKSGVQFAYPEDPELLEERKSSIETLAKNYGLYLINKLDLSELQKEMIGSAAEYVSDIPAIWAYKSGGKERFEDVEITNCRRYSEDCFSVDIYYKLVVTWDRDDIQDKEYKTAMTYTYVKYNGEWRLADFVLGNGSDK